ncbi:MAG TPA: heavy metal-binding domain-containing protein, partial [Ignavibacteriaceae bacterium]|nr:heavy metal-binding domain-containing protein [Ignavibacteriaceae bacterium]
MKKFNLLTIVILGTILFYSANNFAQDKKENCCDDSTKCKMGKMDHSMMMDSTKHKMMDHKKMHNMDMMKDSSMHKMKMKNHSTMMDSTNNKMTDENDSIVREGVIDLEAIDKNNDGKVFQDMMDYNVISDKAGKCPLCGMTLKEVSLDKAKNFLIKNGYKVKE